MAEGGGAETAASTTASQPAGGVAVHRTLATATGTVHGITFSTLYQRPTLFRVCG
jgi:hypothetical protein